MKRWIAFGTLAALLLSCLTACEPASTDTEDSSATTTASTAAVTATTVTTATQHIDLWTVEQVRTIFSPLLVQMLDLQAAFTANDGIANGPKLVSNSYCTAVDGMSFKIPKNTYVEYLGPYNSFEKLMELGDATLTIDCFNNDYYVPLLLSDSPTFVTYLDRMYRKNLTSVALGGFDLNSLSIVEQFEDEIAVKLDFYRNKYTKATAHFHLVMTDLGWRLAESYRSLILTNEVQLSSPVTSWLGAPTHTTTVKTTTTTKAPTTTTKPITYPVTHTTAPVANATETLESVREWAPALIDKGVYLSKLLRGAYTVASSPIMLLAEGSVVQVNGESVTLKDEYIRITHIDPQLTSIAALEALMRTCYPNAYVDEYIATQDDFIEVDGMLFCKKMYGYYGYDFHYDNLRILYQTEDILVVSYHHSWLENAYFYGHDAVRFIKEDGVWKYDPTSNNRDMYAAYALDATGLPLPIQGTSGDKKITLSIETVTDSLWSKKNAAIFYHNGYARFVDSGTVDDRFDQGDGILYNFLDTKGNRLFEKGYPLITQFDKNGVAVARKADGAYVFVNTKGEETGAATAEDYAKWFADGKDAAPNVQLPTSSRIKMPTEYFPYYKYRLDTESQFFLCGASASNAYNGLIAFTIFHYGYDGDEEMIVHSNPNLDYTALMLFDTQGNPVILSYFETSVNPGQQLYISEDRIVVEYEGLVAIVKLTVE